MALQATPIRMAATAESWPSMAKKLATSMRNMNCGPAMQTRLFSVSTTTTGTFAAARLIARPALMSQLALRSYSTPSHGTSNPSAPFSRILNQAQKRSYFGNTSVLAHMEETANKNPNSATAQNAFYQALLRANMPAIIAERYQTGLYASNQSCYSAYQKALAMMGQADAGAANYQATSYEGQGQGQGISTAQMQAVGQAVAAHTQGVNLAYAGKITANSVGAKDLPLHVVIDESMSNVLFRWVKLFLYFGLIVYISMVFITMLIDSLNLFKGRAGAKMSNEAKPEHQKVRFSDVHGCDEAKDELHEVVDFLKNPDKFSTLGGKLPKGVLLVGPPGTGKTLLARAVAGESGVPFFFMSGSEFDEMYVGVGAKRVRELFNAAKEKAPAIVFIDELDAIGGKRSGKDMAYVKQTLNQLLTELDGFEQNSGVIILGATNFPDSLDKALTRPGRFDRNVVVGLPDVRGRVAILKHHSRKVTVGKDVDMEVLAAGTPGFSGAELENVINQAAVHASKLKQKVVTMLDMEWAKDKVMMGAEKRSMIISSDEKEATAYHEAGHALVGMFTPGAMQLHKVTIMPRGRALGITHFLPEMDKHSRNVREYKAQIDVCLGGKVAEQLRYGAERVTSGVSSDLQSATAIAYAMVTQFGMSEKVGNVDLYSNHNLLSSETKRLVESEVRRLTDEGKSRAEQILRGKRKELELLAKALVEYETLTRAEAYQVIKGEKLDRPPVAKYVPSKIAGDPGDQGLGGVIPPIPGSPGSNTGPSKSGTEPPTAAGGYVGRDGDD